MNILLLSRYGRMGASSRYRSYQYVPLLRKQGWDVTVAPLLDDTYVRSRYFGTRISLLDVFRAYMQRVLRLLRAKQYDLIWLEYEAFPWIPDLFESLLFSSRVPYVVDYDDAVFHRYDQHSSGFVRRLLGKKIDRIMRGSSMVIAGNEYIAERAHKVGASRVEILPTVVDIDRYTLVPLSEERVFTIGWIGSPLTSHYIKIIQPVLKELSRDRELKVVAVGAGMVEFDNVPVQIIPWSEATEVQELQKFDVGIMPLPDSPWERGKCGLKLIQYMACAIPVVASPVGVNKKIIDHGVNGFCATSMAEWIEALSTLQKDKTLQHRMGMSGRAKVEREYSLQVTTPKLVQLLSEARWARTNVRQVKVNAKLTNKNGEEKYSAVNEVLKRNIDQVTVNGFGNEWSMFNQHDLDPNELNDRFMEYFKFFPWESLPQGCEGFDLGCGSGRWAKLVADKVGVLHCIDASEAALEVAKSNLMDKSNVRFYQASVDAIPLPNDSLDFGYSIGVLHHVPNTFDGLKACVSKLKPGAPFLLYLYYAFDNRPRWYRSLWKLSDWVRGIISHFPFSVRYWISQFIAASIYFPFARFSRIMDHVGLDMQYIPLHYYRNKSFYTMRTDALDRFGTRLEQRFSAVQISKMMEDAGLEHVYFNGSEPFWVAIGHKKYCSSSELITIRVNM